MTDDRWQHAADLAAQLLRTHGPLNRAEWTELLVTAGIDDEVAATAVLDSDPIGINFLADGRFLHTADLLPQLHFTHRLTADEIAADLAEDSADLDLLTSGHPSAPSIVTAFDDTILRARDAEHLGDRFGSVLVLPRGTLADFAPGDLVEVSLTPAADPTGTADDPEVRLAEKEAIGDDTEYPPVDVKLTRVTDPADDDLTGPLEAALQSPEVNMLTPVLWTVVTSGDHLRRPGYPESELIERAGFTIEVDWIARSGFDFDAWRERLYFDQARQIGYFKTTAQVKTGLDIEKIALADADSRAALVTSMLDDDSSAFNTLEEFDTVYGTAELMFRRAIIESPISAGHASDYVANTAVFAGFEATGRLIARHASRRGKAGGMYLAAAAAAARDDFDTAETLARETLLLDPAYITAQRFLLAFAAMKNDFDGARAAIDQFPDDVRLGYLAELDGFSATNQPEPGRNDPCWCGSGRKYKVCHRGKPRLTDYQRNSLLLFKCMEYSAITGFRLVHDHLADLRRSFVPTALHAELDDDTLISDILMIEGGMLRAMLDAAATMLPAEDHQLAEQWLTIGRSVFQVEEIDPGRGFTALDLRSGERIDITEDIGSEMVEVGSLICCRIVPEADTHVLYGGLEPVAPEDRDEAIALLDSSPTAQELIIFLSRRFDELW